MDAHLNRPDPLIVHDEIRDPACNPFNEIPSFIGYPGVNSIGQSSVINRVGEIVGRSGNREVYVQDDIDQKLLTGGLLFCQNPVMREYPQSGERYRVTVHRQYRDR